jgi:hypothetical protein
MPKLFQKGTRPRLVLSDPPTLQPSWLGEAKQGMSEADDWPQQPRRDYVEKTENDPTYPEVWFL